MNRRSFLQRLGAGVAAAFTIAKAPVRSAAAVLTSYGSLTYRGVPLVYDEQCQRNRVYFINPKTHRAWTIRQP